MMFNCKIEKTIAVLSIRGTHQKRLSIARWNGGQPVFDLRTWAATDEGLIPCKGLTFTREEAERLLDALDDELYPVTNAAEAFAEGIPGADPADD